MTTPKKPDDARLHPNRKVRQRRPWRALLPSPRTIFAALGRGLRRSTPVILTVVGLGGVSYGAVAGARWLRTTPRFGLHTVTVSGNQHVTKEELLRRAHLAMGTNLFTISLRELEQRIGEDPWVSGVEVSRSLPDGLAITVSERHPTALIMVDGGVYLADETGRPFKRAAIEAGEGAGLTIVSGLDRKLFAADPELAAAAVRRAVEISAIWRTGHDRPAVGEVHLGHGTVTLYTLEGAVAVELGRVSGMGPAADALIAATLARFDATWSALTPAERTAAKTIHLDSRTRPDRVTVTLGEVQPTNTR